MRLRTLLFIAFFMAVMGVAMALRAAGAPGPLWESTGIEHIWSTWRYLGNEHMMYPMYAGQLLAKIGPEHQLFVDNYLIAEASEVTREVHHPIRHEDNPLLRPADEKPGSGIVAKALKVIQFTDPPRFRMWYLSCDYWHEWKDNQNIRYATSYAVSDDGIHWRRPELNLYHIQGSSEKNIILPYGLMQGVFYEPWEQDPQKRFKALVCMEARRKGENKLSLPEGYYLHTSPDGIHWKADLSHYVLPSLTAYDIPQDGIGDTTRFWWDPLRKKYIGDVKFVIPGTKRCRGIMESDDLIHWTRPHPTLFARREQDEIYGHTGFAYQGMYIGLRWVYRSQYAPPTHSMDVELDCSRDGNIWTRVGAGQRFMALNREHDTWDCNDIKPTSLMVVGDEIWIYYTAFPSVGWENPIDTNLPPTQRISHYSTGLARLKLDRFASINGSDRPGRLVTRPLDFVGKTLHLNAQIEPEAEIRVGLLSRTGEPISGFDIADCIPVKGDALDIPVRWSGGSDISSLSNSHVRIEFRLVGRGLDSAKLYSFWIE